MDSETGLPKTRPVHTANEGMDAPLSDIISEFIEPFIDIRDDTNEVISTEDQLSKVNLHNERVDMASARRVEDEDKAARGLDDEAKTARGQEEEKAARGVEDEGNVARRLEEEAKSAKRLEDEEKAAIGLEKTKTESNVTKLFPIFSMNKNKENKCQHDHPGPDVDFHIPDR